MTTKRKLLPGQPGTKKLLQKYGNNLVCVRYRYDEKHKRRLKTVEIIVDEVPWQPNPISISYNRMMNIRVGYNETHIRNLVKGAGGIWNSQKKVWKLPYRTIIDLGLIDRIVNIQ